MPDNRPLIVHVLYRFSAGGMERDVVKLVNGLPASSYRHAIISLTGKDDLRREIVPPDVPLITLDKRPGHDLRVYGRFLRAVRSLRPQIVHTCNLATLELQSMAFVSGVPGRVHGEFGWDMSDLGGVARRYRLLRRLSRPFVQRYVTVSRDIAGWLERVIGVPPEKVRFIPRGVDLSRFTGAPPTPEFPPGFLEPDSVVVGTVARMTPVKDLGTLIRAFLLLRERLGADGSRLRLLLVGGGRERDWCRRLLGEAGVADVAWLPGERSDIPELLGAMRIFISSSLAEGMPNAILEAMAAGLPVVATRVGGVPEIVTDGATGTLVEPRNPEGIAVAVERYLRYPEEARAHGAAGRARVLAEFSLESMLAGYRRVFDDLIGSSHDRRNRR